MVLGVRSRWKRRTRGGADQGCCCRQIQYQSRKYSERGLREESGVLPAFIQQREEKEAIQKP